jgi:glycosyltransferase involved in cell wall biosynthesis
MPVFSIIIPCFNEEDGVAGTVSAIRQQLGGAQDYELILVNDGSTDGTKQKLEELVGVDPLLRVVHHDRNRGYGAALKTGIRHARTDWIVITDADGTYPNERIPELMGIATQSPDVAMVVGARVADDVQYPLIRRIPKVFLRRYCNWLSRTNIPDINSGLRVMRRERVDEFLHILPNGFSFTTTITVAMLTNYYDVRFVPIGYKQRVGRSKIKPIRDTIRFIQLITRTGMYFAPMRLLFPPAVLLFLAAIASTVYDFIHRDLGDKTVLLFMLAMITAMFAMLADMIDKRNR